MPTNAERIGAVVELRDYLEVNPKIANIATEINNQSFQYNGFSKSRVKGKICFEVGKLAFLKERLDSAEKRIISDKVPRLYNTNQSELRDELNTLSSTLYNSLRTLNSFCEGDLKLGEEEIRESVSDLSKVMREAGSKGSDILESDDILMPQATDLYIEYTGAKTRFEETLQEEGESGKKCGLRDLF